MSAILVVDDNTVTLRLLTAALEHDGHVVFPASSGAEALALRDARRFDLCIVDLVLPEMDGFELARQLRRRPSLHDVPLIALSGLIGQLDERAGPDTFDAWLVKPVEPSHLVEVVRAHLPVERAFGAGTHSGRVLLVDDDPVQAKLARLHLSHLGFEVITAGSGADALVRAHEEVPDALVSDVLMPDMDGFELCLRFRRDPALHEIPVILVSAHFRETADRELAQRVGAAPRS